MGYPKGKYKAWWLIRGVPNPATTKEGKEKVSKTMSMKHRDEGNPAWKGDNVSYKSLHQWIQRKKGIAKICSRCGKEKTGRDVGWANIDHKYSRNLNDYIALCNKCHTDYDKKLKLRKNMR